jgi:hypothetical protein
VSFDPIYMGGGGYPIDTGGLWSDGSSGPYTAGPALPALCITSGLSKSYWFWIKVWQIAYFAKFYFYAGTKSEIIGLFCHCFAEFAIY